MADEKRFPTANGVSEVVDRLKDYLAVTDPSTYRDPSLAATSLLAVARAMDRANINYQTKVIGWLPGTAGAFFNIIQWIEVIEDQDDLPSTTVYAKLFETCLTLHDHALFNLGQEFAEFASDDPRRPLQEFLVHLMTRSRKSAPNATALVRELMDREYVEFKELMALGWWDEEGDLAIAQTCKRINKAAEEVALPWRFLCRNGHVIRVKS